MCINRPTLRFLVCLAWALVISLPRGPLRADDVTANQVSEVEVRGWDPQKKEPIVGKATAPAAKLGGVLKYGVTGETTTQDPHGTQSTLLLSQGPGNAYSRLVTPTSGPQRKGDELLIGRTRLQVDLSPSAGATA